MSCCATDIVQIPGPQGAPGSNGTNGTNGTNAFTTLTVAYTMPAELASSDATVATSTPFSVGQTVFVQFLGFLQVTAKPDSTHLTLKNLEDAASSAYLPNSPAGTIAAIGASVVPAGIQGPSGTLSGAAGGQLSGTYPNPLVGILTTKGDTLQIGGGGIGTSSRLAVGTDGTRLVADAASTTGQKWAKVTLSAAAEVTGTLPIGNGGTAATTAAGARTALAVAASGANADITSLAALGTPLSVAQGGTAGNTAAAARASLGLTKPTGSTAYIRDQKASTTVGGTFTLGAWKTRDINTEVFDADGIVSIAANQFTLIAGTYLIYARAPAYKVDSHQIKLRNITDATDDAIGTSSKAAAADTTMSDSWLRTRITIAAPKTYEIQHQSLATELNDGFGFPCGFGVSEVYTEVWIEKEVG